MNNSKKPEKSTQIIYRDGCVETLAACKIAAARLAVNVYTYGITWDEFETEMLNRLEMLWQKGDKQFFADDKGNKIDNVHAYMLEVAINYLKDLIKKKKLQNVYLDDLKPKDRDFIEKLFAQPSAERKVIEKEDDDEVRASEEYLPGDKAVEGWRFARDQHYWLHDVDDRDKHLNPMFEYMKRTPVVEIDKNGNRKVNKQALLCRLLWAFLRDENFRILCSILEGETIKLPSEKKQQEMLLRGRVGQLIKADKDRKKLYNLETVVDKHGDATVTEFDDNGKPVKTFTEKAKPVVTKNPEDVILYNQNKLTIEQMAGIVETSVPNLKRIIKLEKQYQAQVQQWRQLLEASKGTYPEDTAWEVIHQASENRKKYNHETGISLLAIKLGQMILGCEQRRFMKKIRPTMAEHPSPF